MPVSIQATLSHTVVSFQGKDCLSAFPRIRRIRLLAQVSVQATMMQMMVDRQDLAPVPADVAASRKPANRQTPAGSRKRAKPAAAPPASAEPFQSDNAMVQTAANTVDIRGQRVEEVCPLSSPPSSQSVSPSACLSACLSVEFCSKGMDSSQSTSQSVETCSMDETHNASSRSAMTTLMQSLSFCRNMR